MITRICKNILKYKINNNSSTTTNPVLDSTEFINMLGEKMDNIGLSYLKELSFFKASINADYNKMYVYFGNGINGIPTEPSLDDYCLNSIIDNIKINSFNFVGNPSLDSTNLFQYVAIIENITDEPISICEIGLCTYFTNHDNEILIFRETFPTVTLQPGETRSFTINFM